MEKGDSGGDSGAKKAPTPTCRLSAAALALNSSLLCAVKSSVKHFTSYFTGACFIHRMVLQPSIAFPVLPLKGHIT